MRRAYFSLDLTLLEDLLQLPKDIRIEMVARLPEDYRRNSVTIFLREESTHPGPFVLADITAGNCSPPINLEDLITGRRSL